MCILIQYYQYSDLDTEGVFRNYYTGENLSDLSDRTTGDIDGGETENCAIVVGVWSAWTDWPCLASKVNKIE